ncbi:DUF1877 family protein [Streptomyces palmae]|uniref:DUF1877 family protein n=2 Tax=Streptomyces palmae TaxID=1701085 RepID=A0A4Z0HDJ5_9ACTN|nr:DUF1877 family protein [Streptomyces palmae]
MGMTIHFTAATPEELDKGEQDPGWVEDFIEGLWGDGEFSTPDRPCGGPDKAWAGLEYLLGQADDVGLEFLMDGDMLLEDGTLFAWPPEQVASLAQRLRALPWEQLAVHFDPEKMLAENIYPRVWDCEGELEWLKDAYEEVVTFFTEAAEGGYGAFMEFSF